MVLDGGELQGTSRLQFRSMSRPQKSMDSKTSCRGHVRQPDSRIVGEDLSDLVRMTTHRLSWEAGEELDETSWL